MKKSSLICLIIFLNAFLLYFALVITSVSSLHMCWDLYEDDPIFDPYDFCDTEKQYFIGAIRRGFIYWTIVFVFMLIIILTVKESKGKIDLVQRPIIKQQELITTTSTSTTPVHPKFCPECGSKIGDINQKFCMNCGKQL